MPRSQYGPNRRGATIHLKRKANVTLASIWFSSPSGRQRSGRRVTSPPTRIRSSERGFVIRRSSSWATRYALPAANPAPIVRSTPLIAGIQAGLQLGGDSQADATGSDRTRQNEASGILPGQHLP